MAYHVIMNRSDETDTLTMEKEYLCPIPPHIISEIASIEHSMWTTYCYTPYYSLGKFIHLNLDQFPHLAPYIHNFNRNFDFTYQFVTDNSLHLSTTYSLNQEHLTESEYHIYAHKKYYKEHWRVVNLENLSSLIFFQCEYEPTPTLPQ